MGHASLDWRNGNGTCQLGLGTGGRPRWIGELLWSVGLLTWYMLMPQQTEKVVASSSSYFVKNFPERRENQVRHCIMCAFLNSSMYVPPTLLQSSATPTTSAERDETFMCNLKGLLRLQSILKEPSEAGMVQRLDRIIHNIPPVLFLIGKQRMFLQVVEQNSLTQLQRTLFQHYKL